MSKLRTVVKTLTYRSVGTIVLFGLAYLMTGEVELSIGIAVVDIGLKSVMYFGHEYAWEHTKLREWMK